MGLSDPGEVLLTERRDRADHDDGWRPGRCGLAPLEQRIALRYALPGMTDTETRDYLGHHLKLVGFSDQLFSDDAADLIHQTSRGLPRAVNNLAWDHFGARVSMAVTGRPGQRRTRGSEICQTRTDLEVDHIRKLADLNRPGRPEPPSWKHLMTMRRRKTLVICRSCHEDIHAGRPTAFARH